MRKSVQNTEREKEIAAFKAVPYWEIEFLGETKKKEEISAWHKQDKFWEFIDILWNQQDVWHAVSDPKMLFVQYAQQVGIEENERFLDDMEQQRLTMRILSDLNDAHTQGVSWETPFLVNGKPSSTDVVQLAVERILLKPR